MIEQAGAAAGGYLAQMGAETTIRARVFDRDIAFRSERVSVRGNDYYMSEGYFDSIPDVGEPVSVNGFAKPENNGTKTVVSASNDRITVAEPLIDEIEGNPITMGTLLEDLGVIVGKRTKEEGRKTRRLLKGLRERRARIERETRGE